MTVQSDLHTTAVALADQLVADRRDLHMHPEIGFKETRTAAIIAERLSSLGYEVVSGLAETGVLGIWPAKPGGKTVMLRFDMDCLPVEEQNDVPYRSQNPGFMHACGHDGHVAIGLGVATTLAQHPQILADGGVVLLFQPAEEGGGGAQRMVEAGALRDPQPDVSFGLHIWADMPLGKANVRAGAIMASADTFTISITGKGGHGAQPHEAIDSVLIGAHLVIALNSIISRNIDPEEPAVLSVGTLQAGTAHNIIAHSARVSGTIRTFNPDVRATIVRRLHEIAAGVAMTFNAQIEVSFDESCPATICADEPTRIVRAAAEAVLGTEHVGDSERTMGSEDMSVLLNEVPGCYFFLGASSPERELGVYPHHHPRFDFDEGVLPLGVSILCEATRRYLEQA